MKPHPSRTPDHRPQKASCYSALRRVRWAIEAGVDLYCARNQSTPPSISNTSYCRPTAGDERASDEASTSPSSRTWPRSGLLLHVAERREHLF